MVPIFPNHLHLFSDLPLLPCKCAQPDQVCLRPRDLDLGRSLCGIRVSRYRVTARASGADTGLIQELPLLLSAPLLLWLLQGRWAWECESNHLCDSLGRRALLPRMSQLPGPIQACLRREILSLNLVNGPDTYGKSSESTVDKQ